MISLSVFAPSHDWFRAHLAESASLPARSFFSFGHHRARYLQADTATWRIGRIRAIGIGQIATLALVGGIAGGAGADLATS
jgi:hypothetical protein